MGAILIAEDEPGLPEFLAMPLHDAGYAVDIVRNGGDALERTLRRRYAAIVSDDVMPIMDGAALRQALLRRGVGPTSCS